MTDILSEQVPSYDILEVAPQVVVAGGGGTTTNPVTFNNSGTGAASGTTFDGSAARTVSYNTLGASATVHVHAQSDVTGLSSALALLAPLASPVFTTAATFSFLTSGRVPYASTGGALVDNAGFTFDGTSLSLPSSANITFGNSRAIVVTSASPAYIATTGYFGLASGNPNVSDVLLYREAAANLRFGAPASATPVAQTLSVQDASGSNIASVNWTLRGSRATGSGTAGKIVFQVDNNVNPGASTPHTAVNTFQIGWDGIGYATGCGGAVTQTTGRTTGVTLDKPTGAITLVSAAGSATWQSFTVTNACVAATDTINVSQKSGTDLYMIFVTAVAAGSFRISFATTGGTTTEQPVFNFAVLKAVAS